MSSPKNAIPAQESSPLANSLLHCEGHMSNGLGSTSGVTPCALLSSDGKALLLEGTLGRFEMPFAKVVKVKRASMYPWFFQGVRIMHSIPDYPEELVFRPLKGGTQELLRRLRELGVAKG